MPQVASAQHGTERRGSCESPVHSLLSSKGGTSKVKCSGRPKKPARDGIQAGAMKDRQRELNRGASARARSRKQDRQATLEAEYVRLRQAEHTAKGLQGTLDPARVLDALLRRADDPSVDIYDVPVLDTGNVSPQRTQIKGRTSLGGTSSASHDDETGRRLVMSEPHATSSQRDESTAVLADGASRLQPLPQSHMPLSSHTEGMAIGLDASIRPPVPQSHLPPLQSCQSMANQDACSNAPFSPSTGQHVGGPMPPSQPSPKALGLSDQQQAVAAAMVTLHAHQSAHTLELRKALINNAHLDVIKPLTGALLALLSTGKLLRKDLFDVEGALFGGLQGITEKMLASFKVCPPSRICAGLIRQMGSEMQRTELGQLNTLHGMLKHEEDVLDSQMQGAMAALALVATEATLHPDSEKLLEPSAWSQPAALAHLNKWGQLLQRTGQLQDYLEDGLQLLRDPWQFATAIVTMSEARLQLASLTLPWGFRPSTIPQAGMQAAEGATLLSSGGYKAIS
ncbi:hypothetical protein WJX74_010712 [Apatococcus lobatus]|uniref:BZIP domain-containing protein n=1 Tax=Apatococcus lobatus TaxID=904363 RepID=A0AAW1SGG0_9CHLO